MDWLMFASWSSATPAPLAPSSRINSSRARRERTSAYSATTKNALIAIRTAVRMSLRPFTPGRRSPTRHHAGWESPIRDDARGGGPGGPSYLEVVLRRRSSLADPTTVARAMVGRPRRSAWHSGELVELPGEGEVGRGETALRVRGECQADLVP